jgi:hypothetical protein
MSDAQGQDEYIVEYSDGPMAGQTQRRFFVDGEYENEVVEIVAVEGIESTLRYLATDSRDVAGVLHVRYAFDAGDSDTVVADPEDNRANDADFR